MDRGAWQATVHRFASAEEGHGYPREYSCLESPHGHRSLVGYSPRGRRESDAPKQPPRGWWRPLNAYLFARALGSLGFSQ